MDFLYENKYKLIYEALKIILIIAIIIIQLNQRKYITSFEKNYEENILLENTDEIINNNEIYQRKHVDIKGAVEKPGVYEINNEMLIYDQTTPNMIQRISGVFERKPLISRGIIAFSKL